MDVLIGTSSAARPSVALTTAELADWTGAQPADIGDWIGRAGFAAAADTFLALPDGRYLLGLGEDSRRWSFAAFPFGLPPGDYRLVGPMAAHAATRAAVDWALGAYRFDRYCAAPRQPARLCWPEAADRAAAAREAGAIALARDLINTPASDLGPAELAVAAETLARASGASFEVTEGDDLLAANYPLIHAVGRASARAPRLIDLRWGAPERPRVTLVGKGVCFDSGGLNLKSHGAMLHMKRDMGGAAHVLGLARMIMDAALPVRLRVLIPAVENSISGDAIRPMDVVRARNGLAIEIGNTDSEGRLILADALAEASSEAPDLLIDVATLTSAAGMALGPDLPAMYCNDEPTAAALLAAAEACEDPLWRLPLWEPYARHLKGAVAELNNKPVQAWTFAASIYAALFLRRFVAPGVPWIHLDTLGWNIESRPGRPEGGEARNLAALFQVIQDRFVGG